MNDHAFEEGPDGTSALVATQDFDFDALDGGSGDRTEEDIRCEVIVALLSLIAESRRPNVAAYAIGFAAGIDYGLSGPQIAKKLGISKQDFQVSVRKYSELLGLRKSRCMRSEAARQKMKLCNSTRKHL